MAEEKDPFADMIAEAPEADPFADMIADESKSGEDPFASMIADTPAEALPESPGLLSRAEDAALEAIKPPEFLTKAIDKTAQAIFDKMPIEVQLASLAVKGVTRGEDDFVTNLKLLLPSRFELATGSLAYMARPFIKGAKAMKGAMKATGRIGVDEATVAASKPAYLREPGKKVLAERNPELIDKAQADKLRGALAQDDEARALAAKAQAEAAAINEVDSIKRVSRIVKNAEDQPTPLDPKMLLTDSEKAIFAKYGPAIRSSIDHNVPIEALLSKSDLYRIEIHAAPNSVAGKASRAAQKANPKPVEAGLGQSRPKDPDFAASINLRNLNTTDDVKAMERDIAEMYKASISDARRGVMRESVARELADNLGLTYDDMAAWKPGKALKTEELLAARDVNLAHVQEAHRKAVQAASIGTAEAKAEAAEAFARAVLTATKTNAASVEVSRATGSLRYKVGEAGTADLLERASRKVLSSLGGEKNVDVIIDAMSKMDPSNPRSINQFLRQAMRATNWDKLLELRRNFMLSGVPTHASNIISNAMSGTLRGTAEKVVEATIDAGRAAITGTERNVFYGEAAAEVRGAFSSIPEALSNAAEAFTTGVSRYDSDLLEGHNIDAIKGRFGDLVRIPTRTLAFADEFFKTINARAVVRAEAYRAAAKKGLKGEALTREYNSLANNPTTEILKRANEEAAYRTFTDKVGDYGGRVLALREGRLVKLADGSSVVKYSPGSMFMQIALPFLKTPMNIAAYGAERTPLGFLKVAYKAAENRGAYAGWTDDAAKSVLGSFAAIGTAQLYSAGYITGGGPTNPAQKGAWLLTNKPYSIKVGNNWVSYNRTEPVGMVLGLVSDVYDLKTDRKSLVDDDSLVNVILPAFANNISNKTWLRGFGDIFKATTDPVRHGDRILQGFASSFVPAAVGMAERAQDPTLRRASNVGQAVSARTPFLSSKVPPVRDIWGRPVLIEGNAIERAISPFSRMSYVQDFTSKEAARLRLSLGHQKKYEEFSPPGKKSIRAELLPDEYDAMLELSGKYAKRNADAVVRNEGYSKLPDARKEELLSKAIAHGRKLGRDEYINANRESLKARAK